jgi:hypothetical protein
LGGMARVEDEEDEAAVAVHFYAHDGPTVACTEQNNRVGFEHSAGPSNPLLP